MSKTTNKFSPEVRERAVRMVDEHRADYGSEWAAMTSIAGKIGCTAETLRRWCREEASRRAGPAAHTASDTADRKSVGEGTSVAEGEDLCGRRHSKKKNYKIQSKRERKE